MSRDLRFFTLCVVLAACLEVRAEVRDVLRELRGEAAEVSGRITDIEGGVLPGVKVVLTGNQLRREAITDTQGRFLFSGLTMGTYRVETTLVGFLSRSGSVTVSPAVSRAHIAWSLEIGCLVEEVRVRFGPREAAPLVEAIQHLRVEADNGHVSWSRRPECANVVQSYTATVLNETPQRTVEMILRPSDARLQAGREYLAFMWPGALTDDNLVYAVESGRVVSSAPAPLGGMPIQEALALVKTWMKRPPR